MADSFGKKEKQKRKQQKKKEKEQRKIERQSQAKSGSLEDMMAYIDENGNLSSLPPSERKTVINENDIVIGSRNIGGSKTDLTRRGRIMYFNESKGYGFIKDSESGESIFVHSNALTTPVKANDFVSFQTERGFKGITATGVKKI